MRDAEPGVRRGLDTTLLHELLDHTAQRATRELRAQPEVKARLQGVLAESYVSIKDIPARCWQGAQFEAAIASTQALPGEHFKELARLNYDFSRAIMDVDVKGARQHMREALQQRQRERVSNDNFQTIILEDLGQLTVRLGELDEETGGVF